MKNTAAIAILSMLLGAALVSGRSEPGSQPAQTAEDFYNKMKRTPADGSVDSIALALAGATVEERDRILSQWSPEYRAEAERARSEYKRLVQSMETSALSVKASPVALAVPAGSSVFYVNPKGWAFFIYPDGKIEQVSTFNLRRGDDAFQLKLAPLGEVGPPFNFIEGDWPKAASLIFDWNAVPEKLRPDAFRQR